MRYAADRLRPRSSQRASRPTAVSAAPTWLGLRTRAELVDAEEVRVGTQGGDDRAQPGVSRLRVGRQPDRVSRYVASAGCSGVRRRGSDHDAASDEPAVMVCHHATKASTSSVTPAVSMDSRAKGGGELEVLGDEGFWRRVIRRRGVGHGSVCETVWESAPPIVRFAGCREAFVTHQWREAYVFWFGAFGAGQPPRPCVNRDPVAGRR